MNFKKTFKTFLGDASIYFTLLAAVYSLGMLLVNVGEQEILLRADTLCFLFLFSLLAALAQGVLRYATFARAGRMLLHYVILAIAFYFCMLLPNGMRAAQVFVGLVLFSVIYWIGAGIVHLFIARFRKQSEQSESYEKQYQKKS